MSTQRNNTPQPSRGRNVAAVIGAIIAPIAASIAACSGDSVTNPMPATRAPSAALAPSASLLPAPKPKPSAKDDANRESQAQLDAQKTTWHTQSDDAEAGVDKPLNVACGNTGSAQVSRVIGPDGGKLTFGASSLTIPKGALSTNVEISAKITLGQSVAVDFAPHGLRFAKAVTIVANYAGCTVPSGSGVNVYYTNSDGGITQSMPSANDPVAHTATSLTDHFSGYVVGWGRTSAY